MRDLILKIPAMLVLVLSLVMICPSIGLGSVIVSLNNEASTTLHEVEIAPGGTFAVDLNLVTDEELFSVQLTLEASASNVFSVLESVAVEPWESESANRMVGGLDPRSEFATFAVPFPAYFGPGPTTLGSLLIRAETGSAWGTYFIDVRNPVYLFDRAAAAQGSAVAGPSLLVHVIPEPTASLLSTAAAILFLWGRSQIASR